MLRRQMVATAAGGADSEGIKSMARGERGAEKKEI